MYSCTVPGSIMLLGEHIVLFGGTAVAAAISEQITASLLPTANKKIIIKTNKFGEYSTDLASLKVIKPFHFVLTALLAWRHKLTTGCIININTPFSAQLGWGSSAAVTIATHALLYSWLTGNNCQPLDIWQLARESVYKAQGNRGSGTDVAASLWGGIVSYKINEIPHCIDANLPLVAVYLGYKLPTSEVITKVANLQKRFPAIIKSLLEPWESCTKESLQAIKTQDWETLGQLWQIHHGFQASLGTSNCDIEMIIAELRTCSGIWGAKISGSGLGDCVLGLGNLINHFPSTPWQVKLNVAQYSIKIAKTGLKINKF